MKIDPENRGLVKVLLSLAGVAVLCILRLWYVFMSPWAINLGKETGFELLAVVGLLYGVYYVFELLEQDD